MSSLDPIAIAIIGKAVDFLFTQASKTLDKSREDKEVETEKQPDNDQRKEEILKSLIGKINAQEVEHCMKQIEQQTINKHKLEMEIATFGTEINAPVKLVNDLRNVEAQINNLIVKLKSLVEEISNKEIIT